MGTVCNDIKCTQRSWKKRQDLFQGELSLYAVTLVCREDKNAWRYHVKIKLIILDAEWLETWWLQRKKEKWSQLQVKQLIKTLLLKIACLTTSWSCALDHVIFNTWQQRRKLFFFTFNMVKPYLINNTIIIQYNNTIQYNPFCFYPKLKRMSTYSDSLLEWDLNTPVYLSWPLMAHFALQLFLFACYSSHGHCHDRKCGETKDLSLGTQPWSMSCSQIEKSNECAIAVWLIFVCVYGSTHRAWWSEKGAIDFWLQRALFVSLDEDAVFMGASWRLFGSSTCMSFYFISCEPL